MSFPSSPSSQGAPSATESPLGQPQQLSSSSEASRPSTGTINTNGFVSGESIMTPTGTAPGAPAAGGAVRRKPARRANTAERRATHNAVERQRRETLNGRFLDLAGLLPNLANVRRPSKSAIVNSSIALVHTQRRFRAIAARELRQLSQETDSLRREVNEWRAAHPMNPVPSARLSSHGEALEPVVEPPRTAEFLALLEHEDVAAESGMNEQERIAYEMRGGDSGPLAASLEDGEDDFGGAFGGSMEDEATPMQQPFQMQLPQQKQPQVQTQQVASVPSVTNDNANRARAQSLSVPRHLQQQFDQQQQQQANLAQQLQFNPQQMAAAASLIPSSYAAHPHQHVQHQYALQQQQQFQQQAMQMASLGLGVAGGNGATQFSQSFFPPSFDAIAAAAAGLPSSLPNMNGMGGFGQQQHISEQDQAKVAAWNAHMFSAALAAQQHQRDQQQQQFAFQPHTPPASSHGPTSPFGVRAKSEEHDNLESGASTPGSSHTTSSSVPPSLSLSTSGLSGISSSPSSTGMSSHFDGNGLPSSLPSSLASPLHNLSLASQQQQHDAFDMSGPFAYGSAPTAGWAGMSKSPAGTPPVVVGGGGGGRMGGYQQYPMMSIFI